MGTSQTDGRFNSFLPGSRQQVCSPLTDLLFQIRLWQSLWVKIKNLANMDDEHRLTLWLFNIAMENGPFIDEFPINTSIYKGFSMAMLNNQMVIEIIYLFIYGSKLRYIYESMGQHGWWTLMKNTQSMSMRRILLPEKGIPFLGRHPIFFKFSHERKPCHRWIFVASKALDSAWNL